jgi:hypothetical protein
MNTIQDKARKGRGLFRLAVWWLLATSISLPTARAGARVRIVDLNVGPDANPDVVCTPGGDILVVYRHSKENALKVARLSGVMRTYSTLDTGDLGFVPSATLDSMGLLIVTHASSDNGKVLYTLDGGDIFGLSTVSVTGPGVGSGWAPVCALDSRDQPFVAFRGLNNLPSLARFDIPSGKWMSEPVPGPAMLGGNSDRLVSIAIDGQDRPVVAYYDQAGKLELATRALGGWMLRSYDVFPQPNMSPSLAFDSVDAPHAAVGLYGQLSILRFGTLGVITVYSPQPPIHAAIGPHSLAIDPHNGIALAYCLNGGVSVAARTALWSTTQVDAGAAAGAPALTFDPLNHWVVAYADNTRRCVKVSAQAWWAFAPPDFNSDGDVDDEDLQHLASCSTGSAVPQTDLACFDADLDNDGDVDQSDFGVLQACYAGSGVTVDPTCGQDNCPGDPEKTEPGMCGCGVPDTDSDGDGAPDCQDNCPNDPNKTDPGACGCGSVDNYTDTDGDGTIDCIDGCPNDPNKIAPGVCGCGVIDSDADSDGDGVIDCVDGCPSDPNKTVPGACGCGVLDTDDNGNGVPDCLDPP